MEIKCHVGNHKVESNEYFRVNKKGHDAILACKECLAGVDPKEISATAEDLEDVKFMIKHLSRMNEVIHRVIDERKETNIVVEGDSLPEEVVKANPALIGVDLSSQEDVSVTVKYEDRFEDGSIKVYPPFIIVNYVNDEYYTAEYPINKQQKMKEVKLNDYIINMSNVKDHPNAIDIEKYLNTEDGIASLSVLVGRKIKRIEREPVDNHKRCGWCYYYDGEDCHALDPYRTKDEDDLCDVGMFENV